MRISSDATPRWLPTTARRSVPTPAMHAPTPGSSSRCTRSIVPATRLRRWSVGPRSGGESPPDAEPPKQRGFDEEMRIVA